MGVGDGAVGAFPTVVVVVVVVIIVPVAMVVRLIVMVMIEVLMILMMVVVMSMRVWRVSPHVLLLVGLVSRSRARSRARHDK